MEKQEIVEEMMKKGKLLDYRVVEKISKLGFIPKNNSDKTVLLEEDFKWEDLKILKNLTEKPSELDTNSFVKFYTSKYEKMKDIYISRIEKDFVSLDKINDLKEFFIFGIVREKDGNKIKIEDMSSSIHCICDFEVEIDDMIAAQCINEGEIKINKIFFPDIPIKNMNKGVGKICFSSNLMLSNDEESKNFIKWVKESGIKYFVFSGDVGNFSLLKGIDARFFICSKNGDYPNLPEKINQENIIPLSNPSMIEINDVKILLINNFEIDMLRKRYLGKSRVILDEDYLVLDLIPDIINYDGNEDISNYKSTTLISTKKSKPVIIDLESREIEVNTL